MPRAGARGQNLGHLLDSFGGVVGEFFYGIMYLNNRHYLGLTFALWRWTLGFSDTGWGLRSKSSLYVHSKHISLGIHASQDIFSS